jgi:hypothetical protein
MRNIRGVAQGRRPLVSLWIYKWSFIHNVHSSAIQMLVECGPLELDPGPFHHALMDPLISLVQLGRFSPFAHQGAISPQT